MWMVDYAAVYNMTTSHHRECLKQAAVGNQSGGRQLLGRRTMKTTTRLGFSTLDMESSSDDDDNVRLFRNPPATSVAIVVH
jgi:hypothetical protein